MSRDFGKGKLSALFDAGCTLIVVGVVAAGLFYLTAAYVIPWFWDNVVGYNLLYAILTFLFGPMILICGLLAVWSLVYFIVDGAIALFKGVYY